MSLRPARADEAEALAAVHAAAGFSAPWPAAEIAELLAGRGAFAVAVEADGTVEGFLIGRAIAGEAEILTVAVDPAARRRGLGAALVEAAARTAGAAGADSLFLEVAVDNDPALGLYRRAGFVEVGRRRGYYRRDDGPGIDALVLRRELNTG